MGQKNAFVYRFSIMQTFHTQETTERSAEEQQHPVDRSVAFVFLAIFLLVSLILG